jgi:uncharacterized metal-binding protein YceD (DUF177 family)
MMTTPTSYTHPMSVVEASRLSGPLEITPSAEECAAIAQRFGWLSVENCTAQLAFAVKGKEVTITGEVRARVTQPCVATGEPVAEGITAPLTLQLVPAETLEAAEDASEVELDSGELDILGYEDGRFDLGDIIAETLALAVNPWPRSQGAGAFLKDKGVLSEDEAGAFGALASLRDKLSGKS